MAITYSSPNQKLVTIKHCDFPSGDNNYGILTRKVANIGINTLKKHPTAFLLFTDLCLNKDGYYFALSPTAIKDRLGLSHEQYKRAVRILIECNYLIKNESKKNHYIFYTIPQTNVDDTAEDNEGVTMESVAIHQNDAQTSNIWSVENTSIIEQIHTDDKGENIPMIEQIHTDDKGENIYRNITYNTNNNTYNSTLYSTEEIKEMTKSQDEEDTERLICTLKTLGLIVKHCPTGYIVKEVEDDKWFPISVYEYLLETEEQYENEELPINNC